MAVQTTTVEIDSALMERLRAQHPGKDDRTVLEDLARVSIGFQALHAIQRSSDVPDNIAVTEAVRAVRAMRRGTT